MFRFPLNPSQDYIKRVVGLPGDRIEYFNKRLTVNGKEVPLRKLDNYYDPDRMQYYAQFDESLGEASHRIIVNEARPAGTGRRLPQHPPRRVSIQRQRHRLHGAAGALFHDGRQSR